MIKVTIDKNSVTVPSEGKKLFSPNIELKSDSISLCIEFASKMAYGEGYHQANAFASDTYTRDEKEIFINTLQGKIAELGFYNLMCKLGQKPDKLPDFGVWGKGVWEDCDFEFLNGKIKVSLKSTKHFGNLLLLEKDRYNVKGEYLEPTNGANPVLHDYIFLARIKGIDNPEPSAYKTPFNISCEITGFICHADFLEIIKTNQFINKGVRLGIPMIVDNYYIVASELKPIGEFKI
jgi:hypothetical protein